MHILVVEDNPSVSTMLELFFSKEGITGDFASDGIEGFKKYKQNDYDLLILDWMLPGMDGIAVCRKIREQGDQVPIIMLTAKDSESDQVIGFEMGADDYVTKPFSPLTLMARIKAVTRRSQTPETADDRIQTRHFRIDKTTREVQLDGAVVTDLTPKEYDLLVFLLQHPKQVFSREQLLERVWGYQFYGDERTVDVHIKRIRKKITGGDRYFHTVWGVGYKFEEQAD
ncbi:response regulator transcription factor [Planococcus salinarum]|uniref:response regulator transcription factor n=1 Tax=Planococcus salinarum TaxID=622695 RepID=UPI000E3C68A4|nr:response regulator transcription factor [Planococcus salinarum]TAA73545.1 response regulator transcription factor [Planococcus salinarum]